MRECLHQSGQLNAGSWSVGTLHCYFSPGDKVRGTAACYVVDGGFTGNTHAVMVDGYWAALGWGVGDCM